VQFALFDVVEIDMNVQAAARACDMHATPDQFRVGEQAWNSCDVR
jgi:hypothetical protein